MLKSKKTNFIISAVLIALTIIFTVLLKIVDVQNIGPNNSSVGFSAINEFVFNLFGTNLFFYKLTNIIGIFSIGIAVLYACIGIIQWIKRKAIKKIDPEILLLGAFYIITILVYVFFEKVIVNYRPILMDNVLEASYPSSHTMMTIFICISSIAVNKKLFSEKTTNILKVIAIFVAVVAVLGRLVCGVHWFTDIVGGILISASLLMFFYSFIELLNTPKETE